jgi:hypothetical protein
MGKAATAAQVGVGGDAGVVNVGKVVKVGKGD